jgi:hypothetical protein
MRFDCRFHQPEAKARTPSVLLVASLSAIKPVEDARQIRRVDADPLVAHVHPGLIIGCPNDDRDPRSRP